MEIYRSTRLPFEGTKTKQVGSQLRLLLDRLVDFAREQQKAGKVEEAPCRGTPGVLVKRGAVKR